MQREPTEVIVAELYRSWGASLLRFAATLTASTQAAEDIVQEAFLAYQQALASGKEIHNPRAWTITIVRNQAHKQSRRTLKLVEMPTNNPPLAPAPRDTLLLREMLAVLTDREQEVLLLRMDSLGYREIADELGIATGTVSALVARALGKLRDWQAKGVRKGDRGETASR